MRICFKRYFRIIIGFLSIPIVLILLFDALIYFLLHNPEIVKKSPKLLENIRIVYLNIVRRDMHLDPHFITFDEEINYTLKPGTFIHSEIEFSNIYNVNSKGLRDSEEALQSPNVIIIGDGFTMGYGVNQYEIYANRLKTKINSKVLNAGQPSYDTVNEMQLLKRLDRSKLKYLIIQYSSDDVYNSIFLKNNNNLLPVYSRTDWETSGQVWLPKVNYFLGKYFRYLFYRARHQELPNRAIVQPVVPSKEAAELFLNTLMVFGKDLKLDTVKIILLEINSYGQNSSSFIQIVNLLIKDQKYPPYIRNIKTLDVSSLLDQTEHYFVLDDHINASGHEVIANSLVHLIQTDREINR